MKKILYSKQYASMDMGTGNYAIDGVGGDARGFRDGKEEPERGREYTARRSGAERVWHGE
jgi:hypothetical protein